MWELEEALCRGAFAKLCTNPQALPGLPDKPWPPSVWVGVALSLRAAVRRRHASGFEALRFPSDDHRGYAQAMGLEAVLGGADTYPFERKGEGLSYSPLIVLAERQNADKAARTMSEYIDWLLPSEFVKDARSLKCVIAELHDNVYYHAEAGSVSMAQYWKNTGGFEFAIADEGCGFLGSLSRRGVAKRERISSDKEAIEWCCAKDNTSVRDEDDEWRQSLPEDVFGNPLGVPATKKPRGNHHLGLGLYHLTCCAKDLQAELRIVSGSAMLFARPAAGYQRWMKVDPPWQGVIISLRFTPGCRPMTEVRSPSRGAELSWLFSEGKR